MKIGIYAGTFDPVTNGHLSVLQKAAEVFDLVIIAIAADNNKKTLFTLEERQRLVEESIAQMENVTVEGQYFILQSSQLQFKNVTLNGKYSLQYITDSVFEDCNFVTRDAFWHAKNIVVRNSVLKGEYLAWYSENVTFENNSMTPKENNVGGAHGVAFDNNQYGVIKKITESKFINNKTTCMSNKTYICGFLYYYWVCRHFIKRGQKGCNQFSADSHVQELGLKQYKSYAKIEA